MASPSPAAAGELAMETLLEASRTPEGRSRLASSGTLVPSLLRRLRPGLPLPALRLLRNLCAGEPAAQDAFLEAAGPAAAASVVLGGAEPGVARAGLQLLGNVAAAGERHRSAIWCRFFPDGLLELARVRDAGACDALCMVLRTCCSPSEEGSRARMEDLCDVRSGLPIMKEVLATACSALRLGLPFVPPFLGQTGKIEDMIHGVNYASAAAGILYTSGSDRGQHISLTQQIQQVTSTFQEFALSLGEEAASDLISKSIVYVSIGSNDFIHYYLQNQSMVQSLYLPWEFNQLLATIVKQELLNLYAANVRKVVLMGLAPVGCTPHYLWQHGSQNGECVEEINNLIVEFNFALRYVVYELNQELPDAKIVFCDAFKGSMDILTNRHLYGFETTTHACCGLGKYGGLIMCLMPEMACSNASTHVWWDEFHPTDAVNALLADNVWSGLHTDMCYPMNLQDMVDSKTRISNHGVTGYTSTEGIR